MAPWRAVGVSPPVPRYCASGTRRGAPPKWSFGTAAEQGRAPDLRSTAQRLGRVGLRPRVLPREAVPPAFCKRRAPPLGNRICLSKPDFAAEGSRFFCRSLRCLLSTRPMRLREGSAAESKGKKAILQSSRLRTNLVTAVPDRIRPNSAQKRRVTNRQRGRLAKC
jgi:hypothetical protein